MRSWIYLLLALASCAIGQKEVKYKEMGSDPKLTWDGQELIIKIENSKENSALLIYDIQVIIDHDKGIILLRGFQAPGREFKNEFRVKLNDIRPEAMDNYKLYWVDPDDTITELKLQAK